MLTFSLLLLVLPVTHCFRSIPNTDFVTIGRLEYEDPTPDKELECNVRLLAYSYALSIQSYRGSSQPLTYDALQIDQYCNSTVKHKHKYMEYRNKLKTFIKPSDNRKIIQFDSPGTYTIYCDPVNGNDNNDGTLSKPFETIYRGLESTRSIKSNSINKQIILRKGTFYLNSTIILTPDTYDNNLLITSYINEKVWISGGVHLNINNLNWLKYKNDNNYNIWMTKLDNNLVNNLYNNTIYSLFTEEPHNRLTRARYPNGNLNVFRNNKDFISPQYTLEWTVPYGKPPKQIFKNLSCEITQPCLNKSAQTYYNDYTAGYDNICDIWNTENFWCGNYTSGGWAFEDAYMSSLGRRQLPVGMVFNSSDKAPTSKLLTWKSRISDEGLAMILHDQGWCLTMNRIGKNGYDLLHTHNISFEFGGFQGANVNRLNSDKNATSNQPIMAGAYYFDGIFDELDIGGEWYFNKSTNYLYYFPNNTKNNEPPTLNNTGNLVIGNLSKLFLFTSSSHKNPLFNVTISNLNFRDQRYTYMDQWGVPSGGGWALFNGGALYFENTTNCSVKNSYFDRLDGNVIMLYGYNRNSTFYRNEFTMIGDNVMAGWGYTDHDDGTSGLQPRFTYILENYVHEIGLYQLQSSAWFQAKTCQSFIEKNIVFNVPRAAINFNDGFGGANNCEQNLLFNTCTESGDHGPINSWDRMPFLTTVAHGAPSYDTAYSNVHLNFIFANYGASQAFDTDDGSAWYNIYNNFGWYAQGYKNDYGGYNVNFYNNLNVAWGGKAGNQGCWNIERTIYTGPSNKVYNNRCIMYNVKGTLTTVRAPTSYKGSALVLRNNSYYSIYGNVTWMMTSEKGQELYYNLSQMQTILNFEQESSVGTIPSDTQIIKWAKEVLNFYPN